MSASEQIPVAQVPPARPRRSLWWVWLLVGLGAAFLLLIGPIIFLGAMISMAGGGKLPKTGAGVAIIRVEGIIQSGRSEGVFGPQAAASETITDNINRALEDGRVKAILVRINSPGGSPAASDEIYRQLMKAREEKPVIISMGDVAASGGYYVACAGDEIYADAATMTGSIGVITEHLDLSRLLQKVGANFTTITTGQFKDTGNFARPMTEPEKKLIRGMLDDIYQQFVEAVAEGRNLSKEKVLKLADGRVFTGRQALKAGLVDQIGGFEDALLKAGQEGGISGRPRRIEYGPKGLLDVFFGREDTSSLDQLSKQMLLRAELAELAKTLAR